MNQEIDALGALLATPQKVVITMHRDPDADALGSSLGFAVFLKKKGHQVTVISPTDYATNLTWLPDAADVLVYEENEKSRKLCKELIAEATLICCLDFSALSRIKDLGKVVKDSKAIKLMIDHHLEPETFADIMIWDTTAAATAQLVYRIIVRLDNTYFQTAEDIPLAEALYSGIMTDTGSFRHSSTTAEVHRTVAELMKTGMQVNRIHQLIYDNAPISRLQLLGHALSKLTVIPEYRTSFMTLSIAELEHHQSALGDTEGIVNYGLQVENVVMTALFIERKGEIKISFRSANDFSVRDLANAHFDGGGHKNASGGRTQLSLEKTVKRFIDILPEYQEKLLSAGK